MVVQRLVDAYIIGLGDNANNTELLQNLLTSITSGDSSLLELVQALGSYLASEEASRRSKGVQVLSDVLNVLPESAIPEQATSRLVQFFCARLEDATCVPHVLTAINALLRLASFSDKFAVDVLNALFKEVHVQSFQHSTRSAAYQLLELVIQNHPQAVKQMGCDFVLGFAQMLDGEKDPRSLSVAFQTIPKIADLVDIKTNAEDLFDVIFCYFPITFKNREGDPSAISPESLKVALRAAITCSPYFGSMAVKPLVDKASATSISAKIDAYETLAAGTHSFSSEDFKSHLETLVEQIREDVFMSSDESVVNTALDTLESIYSVIAPPKDTDASAADPAAMVDDEGETSSPLDYVLKEAVFQLTAEEIKNSEQIGKILRAVARSSAYNCSVVSDAVIPIIIERMDATEILTVRRELMDVLNHVLSASCDVARKAECLEADKINLLNIYRPDTSIPLDKEYSFLHITRLKGITLLTLLPVFLNDDEIAVAFQTIARASIERNEEENVNKEATHLLIQLSQSKPDQVQSVVLPMFFEAMRDKFIAVQKVSHLLNALGAIGVSSSKILVPVLTGLSNLVVSGNLAPPHCLATVSTIRKVIEAVVVSSKEDNTDLCVKLLDSVVNPLSDWIYGLAQSSNGEHAVSLLVLEISRAMVAALSRINESLQAKYLDPLFARYQDIALQSSNASTSSLSPLFSAAVCSCLPQTMLPVDNVNEFISKVSAAGLNTTLQEQRDACFEMIASIVNKTKDAKQRSEMVKRALQEAEQCDSAASVLIRHWLARAQVSCNDKGGYEIVNWLLELIASNSSENSTVAAEGFGIVLGDHDWSITTATHGVVKVLSKQRFYATVVPQITSKFKSADNEQVKTNLLVVLTSTIRYMPKSVLMNGVESVIPLLLSAISLTQSSLKAASIRTITMVIIESPDTLQKELSASIIPLLILSISQENQANTVEVRRATCDALSLIPEKYIYPVVQSSRKAVLRALTAARNDRKRLVRQDAIKAYNKWLSFGES
ncbi:hypothetical protein H4R99_001311 [Coemansia sp. RSA 1722]|nr:hypothetical protein LPJ57_000795 [Coemansia sp. RSA 486]KAJ2235601.1 hypothetical protein IWW45_002477 [Coemansia sp. RSA 485]KAJ2600607.1 hypothetical protein GGF39_001686 [Coemansia sp. RSA 1721]KAJ2605201.1 hypothetical protein H4R99_001311 [Coemansia sp. RSA 1722]KAJ2640331.1 hypothetical protein GGF40_000230 [Coemansia sp. RSA 1286]